MVTATISGARPPQRAEPPAAPDEVSRTAKEFEAMFLGLVVNEMMRGTTPEIGGGGHGEEMFASLLGDEFGKAMAEAGGVGIAASIEQAMRAYGK